MFTKLRELLPANRVAFFTGLLGSVVVAVTAFQTDFVSSAAANEPTGVAIAEGTGKAIVILGVIVKGINLVEKFLEGSQNWDSLLMSGTPNQPGATPAARTTNVFETGESNDRVIRAVEDYDAARMAGFHGDEDVESDEAPLLEDEQDLDIGADAGNPPHTEK